jgi:hypothetical protein
MSVLIGLRATTTRTLAEVDPEAYSALLIEALAGEEHATAYRSWVGIA